MTLLIHHDDAVWLDERPESSLSIYQARGPGTAVVATEFGNVSPGNGR